MFFNKDTSKIQFVYGPPPVYTDKDIKRIKDQNSDKIIRRLSENDINDLVIIIKRKGNDILEDILKLWCSAKDPIEPVSLMYGLYRNNQLVSIMGATYCYTFPTTKSTKGKLVHISGAFTLEEFRHLGYATMILQYIEKEAKEYFDVDYVCCDSLADGLYLNNGYDYSKEGRLYKRL